MVNIDSRLISEVDANELFLLVSLANRMNEQKTCFPSNKTLCTDLKWSKEKLQAVKKSLAAKGFLGIEPRHKPNDPGQTSNIYRILTPQVGNYSPGGKSGTGEVVKSVCPPVGNSDPGPVGFSDGAPVGKPGNEVLTSELLKTEVLTKQELKRERNLLLFDIHDVYRTIIDCLFPSLDDYTPTHFFLQEDETEHPDCLKEIADPTIQKTVMKVRAAAEKIYNAFVSLKRPLPEYRAISYGFPGRDAGEVDPRWEAVDQIKAYADYCRMTGTYTVTDPDKLPEKMIQVDWGQKLHEYVKQSVEKGEYDPGYDEENIFSGWLVDNYYSQCLGVFICNRFNNRIVFGGEEYLKSGETSENYKEKHQRRVATRPNQYQAGKFVP